MSCPAPTLAVLTLVCSLGGCVPEPRDDTPPEGTRRVPVTPVPCPAEGTTLAETLGPLLDPDAEPKAPVALPGAGPVRAAPVRADDRALARGPALRLHNDILAGEKAVLERLQEATAEVEELKGKRAELTARLSAADQATGALKAQLAEFRRQLAELSDDLKAKTEGLAKAKAELAADKATIASLEPRARRAEEAAAQIAELTEQRDEARAGNDSLREQALQAALARVKAQQDLVALQIAVARRRALLRRPTGPTEAKAPPPPQQPSQEARP